jgi:hypothetical protein
VVSFVLLSAWLATAIFSKTAVEFKDFSSSLLNLFVLLTTANNPVVWASTYEANRLAFFFFFTYLVLGLFFLMNLAFSVIYSNYKAQVYKLLHSITLSNFDNLLQRFCFHAMYPSFQERHLLLQNMIWSFVRLKFRSTWKRVLEGLSSHEVFWGILYIMTILGQ